MGLAALVAGGQRLRRSSRRPSATRSSSACAGERRVQLAREEPAHLVIRQPVEPHRHRSRADGRQQPPGIHGRQHEQAPRRRLLQQLEERVGRFLARLLRHQPLGVAEDEDPAAALDRVSERLPLEQPHRRHRVARHPVGRPVERLASAARPSPRRWPGPLRRPPCPDPPPWGAESGRTSAGRGGSALDQTTGPAAPAGLRACVAHRRPAGRARAPAAVSRSPAGPEMMITWGRRSLRTA